MLAEVFFLKRPFLPRLACTALVLTSAVQSLRYAAIRTLGRRWTVRILTLPDTPPITRGIYRHIRHPNYAGVFLEILAVPLLHSAYLTSPLWTIANAVILGIRIRSEERALEVSVNRYENHLDRPRFIPKLGIRNPLVF
jgi:methyltransferase